MLRHFAWAALPLALTGASMASAQSPAQASDRMVTAKEPQGLVELLDMAGYRPELSKDDYGDPMITLKLDNWSADMVFYGCDAETHDACESVQLSTGFETGAALTAKQLLDIAKRYRFASVSLDENKIIHIRWDIVTGDGIPAKVLLRSLRLYTDTLDSAAEIIFPD